MKILTSAGRNVRYSVNSKTGQVTFAPKEDIKLIEIDLLKRTEITGLNVHGIESFKLFTKKGGRGSKFIPVRSEIDGKQMTFSGKDGEVFLPAKRNVMKLQLREVVSSSGSEVDIDVLGCCEKCPPIPTTMPTVSPTPTYPPSKEILAAKID